MSSMKEDQKVWDVVLKVLVPISIAYFGWCTLTIFQLEKRIAVIESNRYTPADALDFERSTNERFLEITTLLQNNTSDLIEIRQIVKSIEDKIDER